MGELMRDYLTAEEKNFYMISKAFLQYCDGIRSLEPSNGCNKIWEDWKARGMLTTEMQGNLKRVYTYLRKFCYELEVNLSKTEQEVLKKRIDKFDYKLIDDYTVKKLLRDVSNNMKYAVIERDKFEPILQDIAAVRCVGCKCNYEKCPLYKMLDDIMVPYVKEEPNCPYACNLDEYSEEELKDIQRLKDVINGRHNVSKEFNRKVEYDNVHEKPRGNNRPSSGECKIKAKGSRSKAKSSKKNRK